MNGRTISLTIVGFLIGVLAAAGIGVRAIDEVRTGEDATLSQAGNVSSTTLPPAEYFIDPDETLVASTAVVPTSVVRSGTGIAIEYELVSLAPRAGVPQIEFFTFRQRREVPHEDVPFIFPRSWTMSIGSETFEGGQATPGARVARFELPDGVVVKDILAVNIVDPLMAYPLDVMFALSQALPAATVIDGVRAELLNIAEQGDSTIVQIELIVADQIDLGFTVEGVGSGWRSARFEAEGRPRVNLTWVGGDLPEVMTFRAHGIQWVELEGSYAVSIGRFG